MFSFFQILPSFLSENFVGQEKNKFKSMLQKNISRTIALCLGVFVLLFLIGLVVLAEWTEPSLPPPDGNVDTPLNVGINAQQKTGSLGLGGLTVDFDTLLATHGGNVGIGTTNNPEKKLDVNGTILGRENIYVQSPLNPAIVVGVGELQTAFSDWENDPLIDRIYGIGWDYITGAIGVSIPAGQAFGIFGWGGLADFFVTGDAFKPGGGSWSVSSDERLKKNIKTLEGALGKMLNLRGTTFEWKEPEKHGNLTGEQMGLIAQEVEKIFPEWIKTDTEGYKNLTVRGFSALTIEALRELKTENDDLKARIEALEAKINNYPIGQ